MVQGRRECLKKTEKKTLDDSEKRGPKKNA